MPLQSYKKILIIILAITLFDVIINLILLRNVTILKGYNADDDQNYYTQIVLDDDNNDNNDNNTEHKALISKTEDDDTGTNGTSILTMKKNHNLLSPNNLDTDPKHKDIQEARQQSELEILPLLQWERESIANRSCPRDKGIPEYCCPGSYSQGGRFFYFPHVCNKTEQYERVEQYVVDYLKSNYTIDQQGMCDSCQIIEYLLQYNLTLSFVGDSVTRQTNAGFECELHRRGYQIQNMKIKWKKRKDCESWRHCIGSKKQFKVQKADDKDRVAVINYYGVFRPDPSNLDLYQEVIPNSDIVIFDHGLHWRPQQKAGFTNDMSHYLQGYANSSLTLLAWRETSSQHFDSDGGHFGNTYTTGDCVPMKSGWKGYRMPLMRKAAQNAGMGWRSINDNDFFERPLEKNDLVFLPFRDYTVPIDYLHPGECTHFCYTPYLWLPMWRNLRMAIHQAIKSKHS